MKTDLYTKIVLTVIAVALIGNLLKDVDFVSKAQAAPAELNLSSLNMEQAESADGEMTFFIYENSHINKPFSRENQTLCEIDKGDVPTYIITNKQTPKNYPTKLRIGKITPN